MRLALPVLLTLMIAACGGGGGDGDSAPQPVQPPAPPTVPVPVPVTPPPPPPAPARGTVIGSAASAPIAVNGLPLATVEPQVLGLLLESGQRGTTAITGAPLCAVSVHRVKYHAVGAAGEATDASAAIMVPSGSDPACAGPRPVLLYAHGTSLEKNYDMADLARSEPRLLAAMFAARGFIVVAPNYAGYAGSALAYHPYLDASQQSGDMLDALRAARSAFGAVKAVDSGKLLLAGYSQGGHVALATQRAMEEQGGYALTAVSAMSGPYALLPFGDMLFGGTPSRGSQGFLPLLITAAQRAGGKLFADPGELFEAPYAGNADRLAPALFARNSLPQGAGAASFFGDDHLIRSSYRSAYLDDVQRQPCGLLPSAPLACTPDNALRRTLQKNDLRTFAPAAPLLLCGGRDDPTVPFINTVLADAYFRTRGASGVTVVDIDASASAADPYRASRLAFSAAKTALRLDALGKGASPDAALADNYHAGLVPPFCLQAARDFFTTAIGR